MKPGPSRGIRAVEISHDHRVESHGWSLTPGPTIEGGHVDPPLQIMPEVRQAAFRAPLLVTHPGRAVEVSYLRRPTNLLLQEALFFDLVYIAPT